MNANLSERQHRAISNVKKVNPIVIWYGPIVGPDKKPYLIGRYPQDRLPTSYSGMTWEFAHWIIDTDWPVCQEDLPKGMIIRNDVPVFGEPDYLQEDDLFSWDEIEQALEFVK